MSMNLTKQKILEAASGLFIKQGYAGTSMGEVAKHANVNSSLIFHHFGNKEGLWKAVKDAIVKKSSNRTAILPNRDLPFDLYLECLIRSSIEFYRENIDIATLIQWQRIEKEDWVESNMSESAKEWIDGFVHYQNNGSIDSSVDLRCVLTMVASIACSAALDPIFFIQKKSAETAYVKFCAQVIAKGLKTSKGHV